MRLTGSPSCRSACAGFSLIELVLVVTIIGLVGAIAIPRLSRGSEGAAYAALEHDLVVLNQALDLYAVEHQGKYPTAALVNRQLVELTDVDGNLTNGGPGQIVYGPYLRRVPSLTVGARKGQSKIATADAADVGWLYDPQNGVIRPNLKGGVELTDDQLKDAVITKTGLSRDQIVRTGNNGSEVTPIQ